MMGFAVFLYSLFFNKKGVPAGGRWLVTKGRYMRLVGLGLWGRGVLTCDVSVWGRGGAITWLKNNSVCAGVENDGFYSIYTVYNLFSTRRVLLRGDGRL